MKKLLIILFFLIAKLGYSQEIYQSLIDRYNTVDYIFEGKVLETHPYLTADGKTIYTSNVIEISKIFKGNLSCGTIEMITDGGIVGDLSMSVSHSLMPEVGEIGIFMTTANTKELPAQSVFAFTNTDKVGPTYEWQSFIKYQFENSDWVAYDLWQRFNTLNDLYDFTNLATGLQYFDCNSQMLTTPHVPAPLPIAYRPDPISPFSTVSKAQFDSIAILKRAISISTNRTQTAGEVDYAMSNARITGSSPKYFEFDIEVAADRGQFIVNASARFKYNTTAFGTDIFSNNKITVSRGNAVSNATQYPYALVQDLATDIVGIGVAAGLSPTNLTEFNPAFAQLFHVKIEMASCGTGGNVQFIHQDTMLSATFFETSANGTGLNSFSTISATQSLNIPACVATITDLFPDTVKGGIGDTLTIRGFQFGSTAGNVYFKNSNDGGTGPSLILEQSDIISWSDTVIQVIVASRDSAVYSNRPFGTGTVTVSTFSPVQSTNSPLPVTIFYSLYNYRDSATTVKYPIYLQNQNGHGGIEFYVDTAISHDSLTYLCVQVALATWSCATGANYTIKGDTFGLPHIPTNDGINYITYGSAGQGAGAKTAKIVGPCSSGGNVSIINSIDVIISDTYRASNSFFCNAPTGIFGNLQTLPANKVDLYFVLLHELGHAVGLNHSNDPNSIMYYYHPIQNGPVFASSRNVKLKQDRVCVAGGQHEVKISANQANYNNCGSIAMTPVPLCVFVDDIIDISASSDLNVAPNPFQNQLSISLKNFKGGQVSISLLTIEGKEVLNTIVSSSSEDIISLKTPDLQNGLYILTIKFDGLVYTKKLIHDSF